MTEVKRERGFFTIAENTSSIDYLRLAYGLALSIQATQSEVPYLSVGVTPGTQVPDKYREVFDEIIELPWNDSAEGENWKLENEWKVYHITPYRETIKLDCDMLFTTDISDWWSLLSQRDFWATTKVKTYRNELVTSDYYRKLFTSNELPNVYTAFMYFKKSETAKEVFDLAELIFHNHVKFFYEFLDEKRPKKASTDVVFALAIKLLNLETECTLEFDDLDIPTFVHMKTQVQNWQHKTREENWLVSNDFFFSNDLELKINNFKQTLPFHYNQKDFLTDDILKKYERYLTK